MNLSKSLLSWLNSGRRPATKGGASALLDESRSALLSALPQNMILEPETRPASLADTQSEYARIKNKMKASGGIENRLTARREKYSEAENKDLHTLQNRVAELDAIATAKNPKHQSEWNAKKCVFTSGSNIFKPRTTSDVISGLQSYVKKLEKELGISKPAAAIPHPAKAAPAAKSPTKPSAVISSPVSSASTIGGPRGQVYAAHPAPRATSTVKAVKPTPAPGLSTGKQTCRKGTVPHVSVMQPSPAAMAKRRTFTTTTFTAL